MRRDCAIRTTAPFVDHRVSALRGALTASSGALALAASLWFAAPAQAQETSIIHPGSMAVTGFSGTIIPGIEEGLPPGVDPVDETFIDTGRATLARLRRFSAWRAAVAASSSTRRRPSRCWPSQIGQVFAPDL